MKGKWLTKMVLCIGLAAQAAAGTAPQTKPVKNVVPDLQLPPETQWNHFSPELIPDFTVPRRPDPTLGTNMPVKFLVWHNIGRGMFRTVTNGTEKEKYDSERVAMLKKGISHIYYSVMRTQVEHVPTGGDPSDPTGLPLDSLTQVVIGHGVGDDSAFKTDWDKWIAWWHSNVEDSLGPLGAYRHGKPAPICLTFTDYEATYAWGNSQDDANHLVVGMYAMLEKTRGYVGQMYLGPLNTCGGISEAMYTGGDKTIAWFSPTDDTVPAAYQGKKLEGNPRIVAGFEVSHYMESFLPEGYQAKDQHDEDFFVVTHFGESPTAEHWAARVGGLTEGCYQYTQPAGQKLIAQLKIVCDRQSGYQYAKEEGRDRWIKQFARIGNIIALPDGHEYPSVIGTEPVSNFVAEGQMLLACFSGANGVNFWGAGPHDPRPHDKATHAQSGEKASDREHANVDMEPMNYTLKAFWRMGAKTTLASGRKLSFYDICDGTEEYLNWQTEVSYDGGKTYPETRAIDWQLAKKTAVRAVVNRKKKAIFILAFQPYGVEQDKIVVRYTGHGATFKQLLKVPAGKVMIYAFDLPGVRNTEKK